jgi:hypothetical protein
MATYGDFEYENVFETQRLWGYEISLFVTHVPTGKEGMILLTFDSNPTAQEFKDKGEAFIDSYLEALNNEPTEEEDLKNNIREKIDNAVIRGYITAQQAVDIKGILNG